MKKAVLTLTIIFALFSCAKQDNTQNSGYLAKVGNTKITQADLDKLYEGFGFVITHGANHDIVKHSALPQLRATLPRHRELAKGYVEFAVKLVDKLLELQKGSEG